MVLELEDKRIAYLSEKDNRLGSLIKIIGPIEIKIYNDDFSFLVCEIISQMLSKSVALKLIERLEVQCKGQITINSVKGLGPEKMKEIGLSSSKVDYIQNLIYAVESNELVFANLHGQEDEYIIENLTRIKGIGNWTAKMYLLFMLQRDNVLPYEDRAFLQGFQWLYDVSDISKESVITECKKWEPYSSIAVRYIYRVVDLGITNKPFNPYLN